MKPARSNFKKRITTAFFAASLLGSAANATPRRTIMSQVRRQPVISR